MFRRDVLLQGAAITAASGLGFLKPAFGSPSSLGAFMVLSEFLVDHKGLNVQFGERLFTALQRHDSSFAVSMQSLVKKITKSNSVNVDMFLGGLLDQDKALSLTAAAIVLSWYIGTVGTGALAETIGYEEALMFAPTQGITVVPTYGGSPNYWVATPPAGLE